MADRILGGILHSSDVTASDIEKGRYYGLQPYVNYKEFCTKKKYRSFADLEDSFSFEVTIFAFDCQLSFAIIAIIIFI